jgi:hypothetical protein
MGCEVELEGRIQIVEWGRSGVGKEQQWRGGGSTI